MRGSYSAAALLLALALMVWPWAPPSAAADAWTSLLAGVEYRAIERFGDSAVADRRLHVVRVDPRRAPLQLGMVSRDGGQARTAGEWCREARLAVAINAGMFNHDFRTHTGYLRAGTHRNSERWVSRYRSALVMGEGGAVASLLDLQAGSGADLLQHHEVVIQNLRLIAGPRRNGWKPSSRRWSEAALASDDRGRLLFLFARSPYPMHAFNRLILQLPLGIQRAQHMEGGPEASLSIHAAGIDLDLSGSYETGFNENDDNQRQWPLPNVLGVARR
jgi:hypothetical protein